MNFKPLTFAATATAPAKTYHAADQTAAFEQLIQNDSYLSSHRGQYAERNAVFLPMVNRDRPEHHPGRVRQHRRSHGTPARSGSTSRTSATC